MSDETATETATTETAAVADTGTPNTEVTEVEADDSVPKWVRDKLTKANKEAEKYRHRANEAAEKAEFEAEEKYSSQIQSLTDEKSAVEVDLQNARLENTKIKAALAVGIPGESAAEFADLLKGETEDEVKAHAEKVKELFGNQQPSTQFVDKSQGLGGGNAAGPADQFGSFIMNQLSR